MGLKPCPFCGGYARKDESYSYFRDAVIYCEECNAVFTLDGYFKSNEEDAEAWNRRADNETD